MPEESKKNQQKGPKDQRKPRNRHQAGPAEKKIEKKSEEPKVPQKPPVYEEPGPEFYKGLKRETDEILKITEEANSKYKKKEIQSNWSKYEMPIESYDEIEEQENMGADYEKLIEAPLSIGGHFQFKHEKSWDVDTGPSVYDKYFEVNMDNLFLSIASIPFHERINVDKSIFSETDILTMNNRATRFKQKYYNNKNFTTPELIVEDNILNSLKENIERVEDSRHDVCEEESEQIQEHLDLIEDKIIEKIQDIEINEIKLGNEKTVSTEMESVASNSSNKFIQAEPSKIAVPKPNKENNEDIDNFDDLILGDKNVRSQELKTKNMDLENKAVADNHAKPGEPTVPSKSPIIESPEDLEKWLDDFLDG